MINWRWLGLLAMIAAVLACTIPLSTPPPSAESTAPPPPPTVSPTEFPPAPTDTSPAPIPTEPTRPDEVILILEPGPASRVLSPVRVAGIADPAFEQTLVVRILLDDGSQAALTTTFIQADIGQRGPFAVDVPFSVAGERHGFIQVFVESACDGGITHLASVGVRLLSGGSANISSVSPHPETITISHPAHGDTVSGGVAHIEGFGLATFEQTLVAAVYDASGNQVGVQPLIVNSPDWGIPGPFSVDVPYTAFDAGPGRIVVFDPSVVFSGENHLSSVEISLSP